jgi:hypothetical protein
MKFMIGGMLLGMESTSIVIGSITGGFGIKKNPLSGGEL